MKHEEARARRAAIVRLAEQGVDDWIIAMALGLAQDTVRSYRYKAGIRMPRKPKPPKPTKAPDPRLPRLKTLVAERATLKEIGTEFGVSCERARQLCNKYKLTRKATPVQQLTRFHSLADDGLRRCVECQIAKPLDEMVKSKQFSSGYSTRCKTCMRARVPTAYKCGSIKEYMRAYRQTERGREVSRRASAKYAAKQKSLRGA